MPLMKFFRPLLVGFSLIGLSVLAAADTVQKQIQANYLAMNAAFKKKDIDGYSKFYAADFKAVDGGGKTNDRVHYLSTIKRQMLTASNVELTRQVIECKVTGSQAKVIMHGTFKASVPLDDGKTHKIDQKAVSENIWEKSSKSWMLKSSRVISSAVLIDGKPLKAAPRMGKPTQAGH